MSFCASYLPSRLQVSVEKFNNITSYGSKTKQLYKIYVFINV